MTNLDPLSAVYWLPKGHRTSLDRPNRPNPVFEIPLLGTIPAGFGSGREQENDECVPVTSESIGFELVRNTFALRVTGDSMIGKRICDEDIVVFEHGPPAGRSVAAT